MAMEGEIGVGVVKLKVDFAKLDRDLKKVMPKVRYAIRGGAVIPVHLKTAGMARDMRAALKQMPHMNVKLRLDIPAFGRDIRRAADMVNAFRRSVGQNPIRITLNTTPAQQQLTALRARVPQNLAAGVSGGGGGGGGIGMGGIGMGGIFGGVFGGNIAANMALKAGKFAMDAVTDPVVRGINANASLEMYHKSLTTVLRDQKKANDLFEELKRIDIDLPVEIDLLASEAMKLAGAGFEAGKIGKMLVTLADAAAVSPVGINEGTSRAVRAITQMRAKGNIQMEDLNQLSEIGIPIRQIIQDQFGMSAQMLGEKTRSGEISIDDAITGMMKGFDVRFGGALQDRAGTFVGLIDQVTARYTEFSREISKPIFDNLEIGLKNVVEILKSPEFKQFTANTKQAVGGLSEIAGTSIDRTTGQTGGLTGTMAELSSLTGFATSFASTLFKNSDDALPTPGAFFEGGLLSLLNPSSVLESVPGSTTRSDARRRTERGRLLMENRLSDQRRASRRSAIAGGFSSIAESLFGASTIGLAQGLTGKAKAGQLGTLLSGMGSQTLKNFGLEKFSFSDAVNQQVQHADQMRQQNQLRDLKEAARLSKDETARTTGADADRDAFKAAIQAAIKANPDLAEAIRTTEFSSTLQRDENGNLRTQFDVAKLGQGPGAVQMSDFGSLNALIQGQVDQARMAKHAEDTAKATAELVRIANLSHATQEEILRAQDAKPVAIVAP